MSNVQTQKTESTAAYVIRITAILLIITAVVAAALAGVNSITAPIIEELEAEKTQNAIKEVLASGYDEEITDFDDQDGLVTNVYKGADGYAVQVAPAGFDGAITMMVGIDNEGNILGVSVISQSETAGLGAVCAAATSAGENFRGQFVGQSGSVSVTKDGGTIDAITGATITSRAVCKGISAALACVAGLKG